MDLRVGQVSNKVEPVQGLRLRCPSCTHQGILSAAGVGDAQLVIPSMSASWVRAGMRMCPNPDCRCLIFVICDDNLRVLASFPAERIDFDSTGIPASVLACFDEAVTCHSQGCYVAAGMMVRKTLEQMCEDRGASGANLKARVAALGGQVVLPKELLEGLDDLRLLGNDAAHVEAKTYLQVGVQEIEIAIDFTKEVLKAVYQYSDLLARLRSLKQP